jgi:hypothetical protein
MPEDRALHSHRSENLHSSEYASMYEYKRGSNIDCLLVTPSDLVGGCKYFRETRGTKTFQNRCCVACDPYSLLDL